MSRRERSPPPREVAPTTLNPDIDTSQDVDGSETPPEDDDIPGQLVAIRRTQVDLAEGLARLAAAVDRIDAREERRGHLMTTVVERGFTLAEKLADPAALRWQALIIALILLLLARSPFSIGLDGITVGGALGDVLANPAGAEPPQPGPPRPAP